MQHCSNLVTDSDQSKQTKGVKTPLGARLSPPALHELCLSAVWCWTGKVLSAHHNNLKKIEMAPSTFGNRVDETQLYSKCAIKPKQGARKGLVCSCLWVCH